MTVCEKEVTPVTSRARERFELIKKTGQLTENHKRLASIFQGDWTFTTKWTPEYRGETVEWKGRSKVVPIYDGRVLQWTDDGILFGEKIQSMGLIGYDRTQKVYRTQYNSYSTMVTTARGPLLKLSKEVRLNYDYHIDPLTGAPDSGGARMSITINSPTQHTVTIFAMAPDGSDEFVTSETVYTKAG